MNARFLPLTFAKRIVSGKNPSMQAERGAAVSLCVKDASLGLSRRLLLMVGAVCVLLGSAADAHAERSDLALRAVEEREEALFEDEDEEEVASPEDVSSFDDEMADAAEASFAEVSSSQVAPVDAEDVEVSAGESVAEAGYGLVGEQVEEFAQGSDAAERIWPSRLGPFPEGSPYQTLGVYDWDLARRILQSEGAIPDHFPEGKVICELHYRPQDIFLPDEPFPLFLNKFHTTTRASTLAASAPVSVGDDYSELLREDVRLELQDPMVFSGVVVVPTQSHEENCVELYVVSRDLWSLRVAIEPKISGSVVELLGVSFEETNFLGLNDTIGVDFVLEQGSWEIGPIWRSDWFMNRNLSVSEQFRLIFDREQGGYEGTTNTLRVGRPLRSSWDSDAWYFEAFHRSARDRVYDGRRIHQLNYRDPITEQEYTVDERWNDLRVQVEAGYTRSYGLRYKHLLTVGAFMDLRKASPAPMDESIPVSVLDIFAEDRLPRSERAIGLLAQWDFYRNQYFYRKNYNSFEVAESYRHGWSSRVSLRYSEKGLGADVRYAQASAGVTFVQPLGDDALWSAGVIGGIRLTDDGFVDRRIEASSRLALPMGWGGRFVFRGWARYLNEDMANDRFRVGATTSLRGYSGYAAEGHHAWLANVEWRSKPVELLSLFFGFAAFLDVGSAWEKRAYEATYASVGLGLRFFVPQAMSHPGSLDVAFPIGHGAWVGGAPSPVISLRFGHAFQPVETLTLEEMWR